MRHARTAALIAAVVGLVATLGSAGMAGDEETNPNWFNDPVEGPSPNPTHEVGNEEGGECGFLVAPVGLGPRALGGEEEEEFVVSVRLRNQADTETIFNDFFATNETGDWGGPFPIPAGLEPGVYPLAASCHVVGGEIEGAVEAGGLGAPMSRGGLFRTLFDYTDRSYTVLAEREAARPVVRVVTFTG